MNDEEIDKLVESVVKKLNVVGTFIQDLDELLNNKIIPPGLDHAIDPIIEFLDKPVYSPKNKKPYREHPLFMLLESVRHDLSVLRQAALDRPYFGQ